jgi:hypothetical protein
MLLFIVRDEVRDNAFVLIIRGKTRAKEKVIKYFIFIVDIFYFFRINLFVRFEI